MQFSEQSLGRKIRRITLINIQGVERIVYEFEESGVTRIHAPSETGKSILTKAMQFFVLGQVRYKDIRESLLRDNTNQSMISIKMYNNREVAFIYKDNTPLYILINEEGKKTIYQSEIPPKEILDELGYYVDKEEDICLNIREDEPLALVHTSDRVNSAIFNCILENPEIESTIEKIENTLEVLKKSYNMNIFYQNVCKTTLNNLEHVEETEEELNSKLKRIDYFKSLFTSLDTNNQSLKQINNHVFTLKTTKRAGIDTDKIRELIELNKILLHPNLANILTSASLLKSKNNSNKNIDFNLVKSQIKVFKTLEQALNPQLILNNSISLINSNKNRKIEKELELLYNLSQMYKPLSVNKKSLNTVLETTLNIASKTKIRNEQLDEAKIKQDLYILNILNKHKELTTSLETNIGTLRANGQARDTINISYIKSNIETRRALNALLESTQITTLSNILDINTRYKDATNYLNKLKEEYKVCPLCQTPFTSKEHTH